MIKSDLDILELQDQEAVKNTFYRYPKITPHIEKQETQLIIKTIDDFVILQKLEEVILYIISDFKFSPVWLIQQWYEDYNRNGYDIIEKWIKVGIVWAETSTMGVFIRPTKFLLDLMQIDNQTYIDIPFGLLNHTCAEEQMCFDIMMGNPKSELWKVISSEPNLLPCYHPLHLQVDNDRGTTIIREALFSINRFKTEELIAKKDKLIQEIKTNKPFTSEFNDFSLFPIVTYTDNGKVITQKPDVVIPIPRVNGQAQSYSIELELSAKTADKYEQIMKNYKNNITFGKLFYLCGNRRIANLVTEAYKLVGGLGACKLFIIPYSAPAQRLSNFSMEDENAQKRILKLTVKNTKKGT
ncbi:MAG: hypothetical protein VZS44_08100 [Bacilli bacterium]|nr:hypothetical protein [Bacilli bacterium]